MMADPPKLAKTPAAVLSGPINLSVAVCAAAGAAVFHSWPVLALGGLTYAALVAHDLLVRPPPPAAKLDESDAEVASLATSIRAARAELERVVADTPATVREHVVGALTSLRELDGRADALLVRAGGLSRYLASVDLAGARASAAQLEERAQSSSDDEARQKFGMAGAALRERVATVQDIAQARERVLANLAHIAATLSGVSAKLVRMRALDEQSQDALGGDIQTELARTNAQLRAFEETLETLTEMA
jgi:hypothetical protein